MAIDFRPSNSQATSTGIKFRPVEKPAPPKKPGLVQSLVQGIAKVPLRAVTSIANAAETAKTRKDATQKERDFGYLGKVKPLPNAFAGYFNTAESKNGTVRDMLDAGGAGAELASIIAPIGKAPALAKATLAGRVGQGIKTGATTGATSGAVYGAGSELQNKDATLGSVVKETAKSAGVGLVTGGVLGGVLPLPKATTQATASTFGPKNIMQRVARVNALDQQKFQERAGKSIGEYLVERGIYGNDEQIATQLYQRMQQSKGVVDDELAKLGGTWRPEPLKTVLTELAEREGRISSPGAASKDLGRVTALLDKFNRSGLTHSEINEVKRLYERNVKLDFLRTNQPESVARANTLDDAIRKWQFAQAEKQGFLNLPVLNKETMLSKQLMDALGKKNARSGGNNAITLTDWIMLSGGDPTAIGGFLAKKTFSSKRLQSGFAKTLAGKPKVGVPTPSNRAPMADESKLLPAPRNDTNYSINQGRAIPVLPKKGGEYVGTDIVAPATGGQTTPQSRLPVQTKQSPGSLSSTKPQTAKEVKRAPLASKREAVSSTKNTTKRGLFGFAPSSDGKKHTGKDGGYVKRPGVPLKAAELQKSREAIMKKVAATPNKTLKAQLMKAVRQIDALAKTIRETTR